MMLTELLPNLTISLPSDLYVMDRGRCVGILSQIFAVSEIQRMDCGSPQGADQQRGAYEWWPLSLDGDAIGELREDAAGCTIHLDDED